MAVFTCPACDHVQDVDDRHAGRPASCPLCGSQGAVTAGVGTRTRPLPFDAGQPHVYRKLGTALGAANTDILGNSTTDRRNTRSSMRKEWFFIDDPRLPIGFVGKAFRGIDIAATQGSTGSGFEFLSQCTVVVRNERLAALELKHCAFDIWGSHVVTLRGYEIRDLAVGDTFDVRHSWSVVSPNNVEDLYASLTYVSRVRTQDGQVLFADEAYVVREVRRFSDTFTESDLRPSSPRTCT